MLKPMLAPPVAVQFAEPVEGNAPKPSTKVELLRTGIFRNGKDKFPITKEHLDSFVKNFSEKVRGIDLAVDYKHDSEDVAAGWFKSVEVVDSGDGKNFQLFAEIDWTKNGEKVLSEKEFRYISADFHLKYVDNETLKEYGPTLLGAGLTNRPVVKGMEPIVQLSEKEGVNDMTLEQAMAKIAELEARLAKAPDTAKFADMEKKCAEYEKKMADDAAAAKLAEKKGKFDKMLSERKVVEAQREAFMSDDFAKFTELQQVPPKEGRLSENEDPAKGGDNGGDEGDTQDQVIKLAEKLVADKKASDIVSATKMVLTDPEHKALAEKYSNLV